MDYIDCYNMIVGFDGDYGQTFLDIYSTEVQHFEASKPHIDEFDRGRSPMDGFKEHFEKEFPTSTFDEHEDYLWIKLSKPDFNSAVLKRLSFLDRTKDFIEEEKNRLGELLN